MINCKHEDCVYCIRENRYTKNKLCGYCYITGIPRGCSAKECIRYKQRTEKKKRKAMRVRM